MTVSQQGLPIFKRPFLYGGGVDKGLKEWVIFRHRRHVFSRHQNNPVIADKIAAHSRTQ